MRIVGIIFGLESSAAYVENGRVLSAVEEEKLSRIKGDRAFPRKALAYILKKHQISVDDIDLIAIGCRNLREFSYNYRLLNSYFGKSRLWDKAKGLFYDGLKRFFPYRVDLSKPLAELFYSSLAQIGFPKDKVRLVDHHIAHAASAFFSSPWRQAVIVTNDGKGDGACGTFSLGKDGIINTIDRISCLNSVGQFYQSVTKALGFKINRHEGKITGLAAYGDYTKSFPLMNEVFSFDKGDLKNNFHDSEEFRKDPLGYFKKCVDKGEFIHRNYISSLQGELMNFAIAYQIYFNFLKQEMGQFEAKDIAAGIQKLAEEAVVAYIRSKFKADFSHKICYAGGVAANVKINQRIREIPGVENIYIQPAMGDAGTSLGAAFYVWMKSGEKKQCYPLDNVYLGPEYSEEEIEECLKRSGLAYKKVENYAEVLGKLIYQGKIIGRFNGALEWGPRALGNRSILARPSENNINDILNERLRRTEFMPFAPSVLDEEAPRFLLNYSPDHIAAKYMTITYDVNPDLVDLIPAVVHIDKTARPQVVFEEDNPEFYRIIKAYKKHSGFGVIVNTSFNMHEEPVVNTPEDAVRAYSAGAVDLLSLGSFIAGPKEIIEALGEDADTDKRNGKLKLSDYAYSILQIESKTECNMNCSFCPYPVIETKGAELSRDEIYKIIDSVDPKDESLEYICFSQFSEPLLDGRIFDFIKYAKNKGFKVFLATNGLLLDSEEISNNLIEAAPDYIKLSLQILNKDQFQRARGVVRSFELYQKGIFKFLDSCLENNCQSNITVDIACNFLARPELFIRSLLGIERGDSAVSNRIVKKELGDFLKNLNRHSSKFNYDQREMERFLKKAGPYYYSQDPLVLASNITLKVKQFQYGRRLVDFYPAFKVKNCTVRVVSVLGNGSVVPCCLAFDSKLSLGSIRNESFKDLIQKNSAFIKQIKEGKDVPDICRKCRGAPTKRGALAISLLRGLKNLSKEGVWNRLR